MPARAFRREVRASYFAPFLAMALLAGVVLWRVNAQVSVTQWIEHSDEVLLLAKDAEVEFDNMQTAFRSYVASPEPQYLDELRKARGAFELKLEDIAVSVTDNAQQERRWTRVTKTYLPGKFEEFIKHRGEPPSTVFAGYRAIGGGACRWRRSSYCLVSSTWNQIRRSGSRPGAQCQASRHYSRQGKALFQRR